MHDETNVPNVIPAQKPLDPEQEAAVNSTEKAIAVLAGPGSGKTRVLSYRTRQLLTHDPDSRALLLTFTNKAAAEMKSRALGVTAVNSERILSSTFHTFGMHVLRSHGDLVGIDRDFEILEREDQERLAIEVSLSSGVGDLRQRWSYLRLRRAEISNEKVRRFGKLYEEYKRREHAVDFDDLIVYAADLFERNPLIAEAYGTKYRHLLVDEFQDTNAAQFAIVSALCRHVKTVSVFADDDQAIYRFVGAEAENIRRFIEKLGAREYPLTLNYRCREAIIEVANRLISADSGASGRQMEYVYTGGEVRQLTFSNEATEAEFIVNEIFNLIEEGTPPASISILVRSSYRARSILEGLEEIGVPISNWLGEGYDPPERRMLATILAITRGRLNDRQANRLFEMFQLATTEERQSDSFLALYDGVSAIAELRLVREMAYSNRSVAEIVRQAQVAILTARPDLTDPLETLISSISHFENHDPDFTLEHLLSELALGGTGGSPTLGGGIKVASLHRTKGLQWPRVYIIGLERGTLPDFRAETETAISEERRVCFVGVCRAEAHLTLTRARIVRGYPKQASIFLEEMGVNQEPMKK